MREPLPPALPPSGPPRPRTGGLRWPWHVSGVGHGTAAADAQGGREAKAGRQAIAAAGNAGAERAATRVAGVERQQPRLYRWVRDASRLSTASDASVYSPPTSRPATPLAWPWLEPLSLIPGGVEPRAPTGRRALGHVHSCRSTKRDQQRCPVGRFWLAEQRTNHLRISAAGQPRTSDAILRPSDVCVAELEEVAPRQYLPPARTRQRAEPARSAKLGLPVVDECRWTQSQPVDGAGRQSKLEAVVASASERTIARAADKVARAVLRAARRARTRGSHVQNRVAY